MRKSKKDPLDLVFETLRKNPDSMAVLPDGSALIALVDLETDQFMAIKAKDGMNFNTMTNKELNEHIITTLS